MKKLAGITVFLLLLYGVLLFADPGARTLGNHYRLGERIGLYGIIGLGAGLLIITGGIDLSMGSAVGLCTTVLAMLLNPEQGYGWNPFLAMAAILGMGMLVGLINGLLVTKLGIQAFIVTLCGLFIYRGLARWLAGDQQRGLGNHLREFKRVLGGDFLGLPMSLVILLLLALAAAVFLHFSIYGRYFYAIGSNERAARYSGIATDRYKILAYVLCSGLAAFFSILYLMNYNSAMPSETGSFFELYAIAAAVVGGVSLRGGEGAVAGMIIGTAIIWILPNLTNMWGVESALQPAVIGAALLLGALIDEILRPGVRRRRGP